MLANAMCSNNVYNVPYFLQIDASMVFSVSLDMRKFHSSGVEDRDEAQKRKQSSLDLALSWRSSKH